MDILEFNELIELPYTDLIAKHLVLIKDKYDLSNKLSDLNNITRVSTNRKINMIDASLLLTSLAIQIRLSTQPLKIT